MTATKRKEFVSLDAEIRAHDTAAVFFMREMQRHLRQAAALTRKREKQLDANGLSAEELTA